MLHLCLVGNALLAIGGTPKLYDRKVITKYPAPMLGRKPELILHLREMTKANLQTYIDVCTCRVILAVGADNMRLSSNCLRPPTPHRSRVNMTRSGNFIKQLNKVSWQYSRFSLLAHPIGQVLRSCLAIRICSTPLLFPPNLPPTLSIIHVSLMLVA